MREVVLLGAGASVEAGIPDSHGLTRAIYDTLQAGDEKDVLAFVVGGLLFQKGIEGLDPFSGLNVEEVFNAVQLLADRGNTEAAPFISSWHERVRGLDKMRGYYSDSAERLAGAIAGFVAEQVGGGEHVSPLSFASYRLAGDLGSPLAEFINECMAGPGGGEVFSRTCEAMVQALAGLVWVSDRSKIAHLQPLLGLLNSQETATIATLNYDNTVEMLAQVAGVKCSTGIDEWSASGALAAPKSGLYLLKLHGSIDWALESEKMTPDRPMPHSRVRHLKPEDSRRDYRPAVIFGARNKLTTEGPFLDLLRTFQSELAKARLLTVIGYSFRDEHVNWYISQWLNGDARRHTRVLDPGFGSNNAYYADLLRVRCSERLTVTPKPASVAIKEAYAKTT